MAILDLILLIVFGTATILGLTGSVFAFRKAMRVANSKDGDLKMFVWAVAAMASLIVAGMSAAYILLPMIL